MINNLKNAWKEITLISAWVTSVAGSFIIDLPSWSNNTNASPSYLKFTIFFATIIAGFLVLHTFKNGIIRHWSKLSVTFFVLVTISTIGYYYCREIKTLPYEGIDIIIGYDRILNDPLTELEKSGQIEKDRIMRHFHGQSERVWTKESININRIQLSLLFALSYTLIASFIISFCNLIILHREKYGKKKINLSDGKE